MNYLKKSSFGNNFTKFYRKGFSLTELTLALGVIGLFITIITIAIIRGQTTLLSFNSDKIIVNELENYTKIIASKPFLDLYNRNISIPDSDNCPGEGITCPKVFNKIFRINWSFENISVNDQDSSTVDYIKIIGNVEWEDATFEHTEIVFAPTPNWRPNYGSIQINISNPENIPISQLYLVDAITGESVASTENINNNLAFISAPLDYCGSESNGCVLALQSNGASQSDNYTIDALSALVPLKLSQNKLKIITPTISYLSKLNFQLYAKNGLGELLSPDVKNSICFYLIFHDGVAKRYIPYCNSKFNDMISIENYIPDPDKPWNTISLSSEFEYSISMDYKNDNCPPLSNMQSVSNGVWQSLSSCFDWTWGEPTYISDGVSLSQFENNKLKVLPGINKFTLTWTPENSSPASGGNYLQPLWSKPRDLSKFNAPQTCTTSNPNCNSLLDSGPTLIAPRLGLYQIPALSVPLDSGYDFTLIIKDYDDINNNSNNTLFLDNINLGNGSINKFTTVEVNGIPTIVESQLSEGDIIAQSSSGYYSVPLRLYTSNLPLQSITIKMVGVNAIRYEKIYITSQPTTIKLLPESISMKQEEQSYVKVLAINSVGEPSTDVDITGLSLNELTFQSAKSNNEGYALIPIFSNNISKGIKTVTISSGTITAEKNIEILPITGSITANISENNPLEIMQGESSEATFRILDKSGEPIANQGVTANAFKNNNFTGDINIKNGNCITNTSGYCTIYLNASASAKSGNYELIVASENISITLPLIVNQKVKNLISPLSTVIQGQDSTLQVKALDGAGDPISGITITASSAGINFSNGITNNNGIALIPYVTEIDIKKGEKTVILSSGNITNKAYIRVIQNVTSVLSNPISVNQGASVNSFITVLDGNNDPIPGILLSANSSDGIKINFEPSYIDGKAYFQLSAPSNLTPASYLINIMYNNNILDILTVRVIKGIGSISTTGNISKNTGSKIYLTIRDFNNNPISNRELKVESSTNSIIIGSLSNNIVPVPFTTMTNSQGVAQIDVYGKPGLANGPIKLIVTSSGSKYIVYLEEVDS